MSTDKMSMADKYIIVGKLWSQVHAPPSKLSSENLIVLVKDSVRVSGGLVAMVTVCNASCNEWG